MSFHDCNIFPAKQNLKTQKHLSKSKPRFIRLDAHLLCAPSAHRRQSCDAPPNKDRWFVWAASLHLTWWTDWAIRRPGELERRQWSISNKGCSYNDRIILEAFLEHYSIVVFVLQVPSIDRTLGCGIWRWWSCWYFYDLSLNLETEKKW